MFCVNIPFFHKNYNILPKITEYIKFFLSQVPSISFHMPRNEGATLHGSWEKSS
jgi:hypothetical protein